MKKYDIKRFESCGAMECTMQETKHGDWVRYYDLSKKINQLKRKNENLKIDASNHAADAEAVRKERNELIAEVDELRAKIENLIVGGN